MLNVMRSLFCSSSAGSGPANVLSEMRMFSTTAVGGVVKVMRRGMFAPLMLLARAR